MTEVMKTLRLTRTGAVVDAPADAGIVSFIDDDGGLMSLDLDTGWFCRHRLCVALAFDDKGQFVNAITSKTPSYTTPFGDDMPVHCDVVEIDDQVFTESLLWLRGCV